VPTLNPTTLTDDEDLGRDGGPQPFGSASGHAGRIVFGFLVASARSHRVASSDRASLALTATKGSSPRPPRLVHEDERAELNLPRPLGRRHQCQRPLAPWPPGLPRSTVSVDDPIIMRS
jgi:hypothetical protein